MNWDDLTGDLPMIAVEPRRGRNPDEPSGRIATAPAAGRPGPAVRSGTDHRPGGDRRPTAEGSASTVGEPVEPHPEARTAQRLKMLTLTALSLVLLLAFPLYLGIVKVTSDPLMAELNSLELPDWATSGEMTEEIQGNRWCIPECEFALRSQQSSHDVDETHQAYYNALFANGWRPRVGAECPAEEDGIASCWKRDQYVLDMWVREEFCEERPVRPTPVAGPGSTPGTGATPPAAPSECGVSLVTVKVFNAVAYKREHLTEGQ